VYGADVEYIQGEKKAVVDALYILPMQELFIFNKEEELPINLALLADNQTKDQNLRKR
jgi:hypothetical protein